MDDRDVDDDEVALDDAPLDDPAEDSTPRLESMDDRTLRIVLTVLWAVGLAIVLVRSLDLFAYLFLSAYVLGLLYALHLRTIGDPEGQTGIWLALLIPPLAWFTFLLHWLDHRGAANEDDAGVEEVVPPVGDAPTE